MKNPPLYSVQEAIRVRVLLARLYRVEVEHPERIPASGPVILVANHDSLADPWFLGLATRRPVRYMAKAELFGHPILSAIMNALGTFPVERGTGDRAAVGRATELLAAGQVLGMFPQGTQKRDRPRPWLRGAARIALATGTTVVPVTILGSREALGTRPFRVGLPQVRVVVREPIPVERDRQTIAAAKELTARMERAVEAAP